VTGDQERAVRQTFILALFEQEDTTREGCERLMDQLLEHHRLAEQEQERWRCVRIIADMCTDPLWQNAHPNGLAPNLIARILKPDTTGSTEA
jgi:hypothetical protein